MHDAAPCYEADTVVIDLDEPRPRRPTARRLPTVEEMTVRQVNVDGVYHRRTPDLSATACGRSFHSQFASTRPAELAGLLCPDCFTPFELAKADAANKERR